MSKVNLIVMLVGLSIASHCYAQDPSSDRALSEPIFDSIFQVFDKERVQTILIYYDGNDYSLIHALQAKVIQLPNLKLLMVNGSHRSGSEDNYDMDFFGLIIDVRSNEQVVDVTPSNINVSMQYGDIGWTRTYDEPVCFKLGWSVSRCK